jgi:F-type H+-transporting ATPase subunit b
MNLGMWRVKGRKAWVLKGIVCAVMLTMLLISGSVWASSSEHETAVQSSGHESADHTSDHEGSAHGGQAWEDTDTYRIINFVVLAVALIIIIKKWVVPLFRDRIKGIKDELEDLEARKKEAEEKLAHYNERLADMEKEAEKIVESYIEQGKEAHARIIEEAKASAEKLEANAQRQIENAYQRARAEIQETIIEKAMEKAEAAIREHISADDQAKLVNEYLEKVVA